MKKILSSMTILISTIAFGFSTSTYANDTQSLVNLDHLNHLYEVRKTTEGQEIGVIHIYSEYPDYGWVKDPIEGTSALDDVARAAIVYGQAANRNNSAEEIKRIEPLINFILHMQSDNGYFNNFIYPDNTVNTTYKTSVAEANWWTWRGIWALSTLHPMIKQHNPALAEKMEVALFKTIDVMEKDFSKDEKISLEQGVEVADWLPFTAGDQSAIMLMALNNAYQIRPEPRIATMMNSLASGLMTMQIKDVQSPLNGAFLSWKNLWHAYGNDQALALMQAGQTLDNRDMIKAAFVELDGFHAYLLKDGMKNWFSVKKDSSGYSILEQDQFAQIAYGVRPLITANIKAYEISRDEKYAKQAVDFAMWFFKNNPASAQMYQPETGRGFDGINNTEEYNKNSGAESTIEALMAMLAIESNETTKRLFLERLKESGF